MKFRKKPVVIEAVQYNGDNQNEIFDWIKSIKINEDCNVFAKITTDMEGFEIDGLGIETLEGELNVSIGDWIIRGVMNELYPCKPDVFVISYESVE